MLCSAKKDGNVARRNYIAMTGCEFGSRRGLEILEKENNQSIMADVMPRDHPRSIVIISSLRYLARL